MKNSKTSATSLHNGGLIPPPSIEERLLTRKDVASLLSVHTETVKRMAKRGELKEIVIRRNLVRYNPTQVAALIGGRP